MAMSSLATKAAVVIAASAVLAFMAVPGFNSAEVTAQKPRAVEVPPASTDPFGPAATPVRQKKSATGQRPRNPAAEYDPFGDNSDPIAPAAASTRRHRFAADFSYVAADVIATWSEDHGGIGQEH